MEIRKYINHYVRGKFYTSISFLLSCIFKLPKISAPTPNIKVKL